MHERGERSTPSIGTRPHKRRMQSITYMFLTWKSPREIVTVRFPDCLSLVA